MLSKYVHNTLSLARRRSRLTLGVAALAVTAGTGAGLASAFVGSTPASDAASVAPSAIHSGAIVAKERPAGAPSTSKRAAEAPATKTTRAKQPAQTHKAAAPAKKKASSHLIFDSVTPGTLPAHQQVAVYANGKYAVTGSEVAGHDDALWIDINGSDPKAAVLDVEPGDASPAGAAQWARQKLSADPTALARIYTMKSEWPAVKVAIAGLPAKMQSQVRYWIADPTGSPHIVPGASATQWYWGSRYDITTANPDF
jgi:hypothetical protein